MNVNKKAAAKWLLDEYAQRLDLNSGEGKREYSDLAVKLINYIKDSVERKHYLQMVAEQLEVDISDLMNKKSIQNKPTSIKRQVKTEIKNDKIRALDDNLLAIMIYGGVSIDDLEPPKDDIRLEELQLVFDKKYKNWSAEMLNREADELKKRKEEEKKKKEIELLKIELEKIEDDEDRENEILRKIDKIRKK